MAAIENLKVIKGNVDIMEFTIRTIVVLTLLLVATLVFAAVMLGWGAEASEWLTAILSPFQELVLRR